MARTADVSKMAKRYEEGFETNCGLSICDCLQFRSAFDRMKGNVGSEGYWDWRETLESLSEGAYLTKGLQLPLFLYHFSNLYSRRNSGP